MNLGEYLAKESINSEIDNFAKHAKRVLPKKLGAELDRITNAVYSEPKQLNELYEFAAKYNLFQFLWRMNRQKITKSIPFVLKNGINGCRKVLDIGCSDGLKTAYYALARPEAQIVAIDRCRGPIQRAKERAEKYNLKNIEFVHADLNTPCFKDNCFDSIIATQVLHETFYLAYGYGHSDGMQAYYEFNNQLRELARILAPEGRLLISLRAQEYGRANVVGEIKSAAEKAGLKEKKFSDNHENNGFTLNFVYQKPE